MSQQMINQQARRTAREVADRRQARAAKEARISDLAEQAMVALGERNQAVAETETRAGQALCEWSEAEGLALAEMVERSRAAHAAGGDPAAGWPTATTTPAAVGLGEPDAWVVRSVAEHGVLAGPATWTLDPAGQVGHGRAHQQVSAPSREPSSTAPQARHERPSSGLLPVVMSGPSSRRAANSSCVRGWRLLTQLVLGGDGAGYHDREPGCAFRRGLPGGPESAGESEGESVEPAWRCVAAEIAAVICATGARRQQHRPPAACEWYTAVTESRRTRSRSTRRPSSSLLSAYPPIRLDS